MGKDHGYIYYEADAFFMYANPFIDPSAQNPSMQTLQQKPLKVLHIYIYYLYSLGLTLG